MLRYGFVRANFSLAIDVALSYPLLHRRVAVRLEAARLSCSADPARAGRTAGQILAGELTSL